MKVLGFDVSTHTGWALLDDEGGVRWGEKEFKGHRGMSRVYAFEEWAYSIIKELEPHLIVLEGYGYANQYTLVSLVEIGTAIRLACHRLSLLPTLEVAPTALKKFATGKGTSKKDEVRLAVYKRWGREHPSDNAIDAFVLAKIGVYLLHGTPPENKAQEEVLKSLRVQLTANTI